MKKITLTEFNKQYNKPAKDWNFDLFKIVCIKCGSNEVEYNGKMETEYGYYDSFDVIHYIVVKCHNCGNALALKTSLGGSADYCRHDE